MHAEYTDGLHLAFVPDGNRRYAQEHGMPEAEAHRIGAERAVDVLDWVDDFPAVDQVTAWALSRKNAAKRSDTEIDRLNAVYEQYARSMNREDSPVYRNGISVDAIGDLSVLDEAAYTALDELGRDTAAHDRIHLNLAFGYDATYDLDQALDAARQDGIDDPGVEQLGPYFELPEVDVFMRYGRDAAHLSGFAPMQQLRQATVVFPGKHWPAAEQQDIEAALAQHRERDITEGA